MNRNYEAVFCVVLVAGAFLWRDNPYMVYPDILYLLVLLLGLNLAAGLSLRLWPAQQWASALIILANCAVITGMLSHSGGAESKLWVLYLLPIYTACMLLDGGCVIWITGGAAGFNAAFHLINEPVWSDPILFTVAVKCGLLIFAAATTWGIVARGRKTSDLLQEQSEKLDQAQKLSEVGLVSSGVAHDLKNPLFVIEATCGVLLKRREEFPNIVSDIDRIRRAAEHCRATVSGILGYAGKAKHAPRSCDVNAALDNCLSLFSGALADAGVTVRRLYGGGLPPVRGRIYELQRVFLNLMSNAKDAMEGGGTLTLRTVLRRDARGGPGYVQLIVDDSGGGLSEQALGGLFRPFVSSKAPGKGTGLGLYMCREIAVQHGGSLTAGNAPQGGARFILSLPAEEDAARADSPRRTEPEMEAVS
ncbi:MAG: HAMP domain-containing sensor histidine kinase [Elusimicrobiota bacterium]